MAEQCPRCQHRPLQVLKMQRICDTVLCLMCMCHRLNVCNNSIGDTGLCALASALETNQTLKQVTIWGNTMGEPTCLVGERVQPE